MNEKQIEGRDGEREAAKYLESIGYKIVCSNFRCVQGEIDIIAEDKKEIVFVEVKTRRNSKYGEARDAVNIKKQNHILAAAKYYLYKSRMENVFVRIDVIEVYIRNGKKIINHIIQAI